MGTIEYVTIKMCCLNAAFGDGCGGRLEAARILRGLARRIEDGDDPERANDSNGNRVAVVEYQFRAAPEA